MKRINIELASDYLSDCSFRNKIDIIRLCINYVKFAPIVFNRMNGSNGNTILLIDRMKRLFVHYGKSIHSVHFPFNLSSENGKIDFYWQDNDLDAKTTSMLLDFFNRFDELESLDDMYENFLRLIDEYDIKKSAKENSLWKVISHLLVFEPAYLRYDEDFSNRMDMKKHPPYHFDLNYCNTSTFKLGIGRKISMEEYIDILNNNSNCAFLKV